MKKKERNNANGEKKQTSLSLNFLMNMILTMSSFIFPLITFPYISRILQADGVGKVQMATSYVSYFIMVSQLGLPTYGIRACAAVRDDRRKLSKTVHELLIIQLVMTVLSYAVLLVTIQMIPRLREERTLYLVTSMGIFLNTLGVEWLFKAMEQYTYITIRSLVFKMISVVSMFLLVHEQSDYEIYAGISIVASYGSSLMNLTQLNKYIDLKPMGGYDVKRHLKPVFVLFAYTCATTIYTNLDSVMLGFMTTDADVGYYSVAIKIKNILVSVVTALGAVLLPRMSYYYERGEKEEFWNLVEKSLRFVLLLSLPLTVFFIIFAGNSIVFLSGEGFEAAVQPMRIIMPTLLFIGFTYVMGIQVLIPMGRESVVFWASVAGAVVDLVLNTALIPSMKSSGAAIGTLAAEAAVFVVQFWALRKDIAPMFRKLRIPLVALAAASASLASFWVRSLSLGNFWILALGAVIFFAVYLLVLHIAKEPLVREMEQRLISGAKGVLKK